MKRRMFWWSSSKVTSLLCRLSAFSRSHGNTGSGGIMSAEAPIERDRIFLKLSVYSCLMRVRIFINEWLCYIYLSNCYLYERTTMLKSD